MRAVNITGWKDSGKTGLTTRLTASLQAMGLNTCAVKLGHQPPARTGSDTDRLLEQTSTVVFSGGGETLLHSRTELSLTAIVGLLEQFGTFDVLVVEGGKALTTLPRIIVGSEAPQAELQPQLALATIADAHQLDDDALAQLTQQVATQGFLLPGLDCGSCGRDDCASLSHDIVAGQATPEACNCLQADDSPVRLTANGVPVSLNPFTAQMLAGGVRGMAAALKGCTPDATLVLTLRGGIG